jgi:hypothetical protein
VQALGGKSSSLALPRTTCVLGLKLPPKCGSGVCSRVILNSRDLPPRRRLQTKKGLSREKLRAEAAIARTLRPFPQPRKRAHRRRRRTRGSPGSPRERVARQVKRTGGTVYHARPDGGFRETPLRTGGRF